MEFNVKYTKGELKIPMKEKEVNYPETNSFIKQSIEEKLEMYKSIAENYEMLRKRVWEAYGYWDESGEWIEYDDGDPRGKDLAQIGEMVAHVFGLI